MFIVFLVSVARWVLAVFGLGFWSRSWEVLEGSFASRLRRDLAFFGEFWAFS